MDFKGLAMIVLYVSYALLFVVEAGTIVLLIDTGIWLFRRRERKHRRT